LKYKNPYYKKIKNSRNLTVLCAYCKSELCNYQKKGKGNLINMYIQRIINMNFNLDDKGLKCPYCKELIAIRSLDKDISKDSYKMIRGAYNLKEE